MPASSSRLQPVAKLPPIDNEKVRDVSVLIYKNRLGRTDTEKMLKADGPEKLRKRAGIYDPLTVAYMTALNVPVPRLRTGLLGDDDEN
jgi:hypothetical protein